MKLYGYWRSSSAWRVRIALAWKHVAFENVPVHLVRGGGEQRMPDFMTKNPLAQVPVWHEDRVDGAQEPFLLTQSVAILEYLEERYPEPPLLPRNIIERARARQFTEMINSGIQPLQNLRLQNTLREHGVDPAPLVTDFISTGLRALEELGKTTAGRFLVGDAPTFADVMLIPQLAASRRFGVDVDAGPYPTLLRIESTCAALPAFQAAHAHAQPDRE